MAWLEVLLLRDCTLVTEVLTEKKKLPVEEIYSFPQSPKEQGMKAGVAVVTTTTGGNANVGSDKDAPISSRAISAVV